MNPDRALLGLLLLAALVIGSNLVMYGIVRNLTRGNSRWLQNLLKTSFKPTGPRDQDMDELHRLIKDLRGEEGRGGEINRPPS
jgi:hypothetical protein